MPRDETDALVEIVCNLRHDEGCSAALNVVYPCRCNRDATQRAALDELGRLRAAAAERDAAVELLRKTSTALDEKADAHGWPISSELHAVTEQIDTFLAALARAQKQAEPG